MFGTCCPIFGGLLADTYLGKFKTIIYMSSMYMIGFALVTIATLPALKVSIVELSLASLAFLAFGHGCITPCISSIGGDQFKIPQQTKQLQTFFAIFYFSVN